MQPAGKGARTTPARRLLIGFIVGLDGVLRRSRFASKFTGSQHRTQPRPRRPILGSRLSEATGGPSLTQPGVAPAISHLDLNIGSRLQSPKLEPDVQRQPVLAAGVHPQGVRLRLFGLSVGLALCRSRRFGGAHSAISTPRSSETKLLLTVSAPSFPLLRNRRRGADGMSGSGGAAP